MHNKLGDRDFEGSFFWWLYIHKNNLADYGSKISECQIPATKKIAIATAMLRALKIPHEITRGVVNITMKQ